METETDKLKKVAAINSAMTRVSGLYLKWTQKHNINYYTFKIFYVLSVLKKGASVTQKDICKELAAPKQSINNLIISFEREGYIALNPSVTDKREKSIFLTGKGEEYAKEMLEPLLKIEMGAVSRMKEQADLLKEAAITFGDYFELEMSKENEK